jgi:mono/diheme cytochrome c family protein
VALALAALPLAAAEPDGAALFAETCAACHGPGGRGDGPLAGQLSTAPPDLTLFAYRNDGSYDMSRMVRIIDGTIGLSAHGGDMPMIGGRLTGAPATLTGPDGAAIRTSRPVLAIAEWLATQQREAPP